MTNKGQTWRPGSTFFRQQKLDTELGEVNWSFQKLRTVGMPYSYVFCHMRCGTTEVHGQGYHPLMTSALRQAFAEAWERLWLREVTANRRQDVSSSNGFAAGKSAADAVAAAKAELLERAIFLKAWQSRQGWNPYFVNGMMNRFYAKNIRDLGWNVRLFLLKEVQLGSVLAGLLEHDVSGTIFDTVYIGHSGSTGKYESKLLRSLRRTIAFQNTRVPLDFLPVEGKPQDHANFYRNPAHREAFAFLKDLPGSAQSVELGDYEAIDTELLHDANGMPAVAYAWNKKWPSFSWGKQSIGGVNPWPHPLA